MPPQPSRNSNVDTPMWHWVVFGAFSFATMLTGWGLWRMAINETYKAFLFVSWLFLISSTFTLAKAIRDAHDANTLEARLNARSGASAASTASATVGSH